jgi:hypothetical protein
MWKMADAGIPWGDIDYLQRGNVRQRAAFHALESLNVFQILGNYRPVLVGTIPIDVDITGSDLDVICEACDLDAFERACRQFEGYQCFRIKRKQIKGVPSVVANLFHSGFRVQIFGQPQPVTEQHAYRHMLVEARLLEFGGERARAEIRRLKQEGCRTEPAFACYFNLEGNPFEVLLALSHLDEPALRARLGAEKGRHQEEA